MRLTDALPSPWRSSGAPFAWRIGLRNSAAVVVPLTIGVAIDQPVIGALVGLATYLVAFADDRDSAFRPRIESILLCSVLTTFSFLVGSVAGNTRWLLVPLVLVWAFTAGMTSLVSSTASAIGGMAATALLVAKPLPIGSALGGSALVLAGGLWMALWVVTASLASPMGPARRAVAAACAGVAPMLDELVAARLGPDGRARLDERSQAHQRALLGSTKQALDVVGAGIASGTQPSSSQAELIQLCESAERMVKLIVAYQSRRSQNDLPEPWELLVADLRQGLARCWLEIGTTVARSRGTAAALDIDRAWVAITSQLADERQAIRNQAGEGYGPYLQRWLLTQNLALLVAETKSAVASAAELNSLAPRTPAGKIASTWHLREGRYLAGWRQVRLNLRGDSLWFRHAARLALLTTVATLITVMFDIPEGAWATVAVFRILRPALPLTKSRSAQRIGGNVIGGVIAAVLLTTLPGGYFLVALIAVLITVGIGLRPVNYGYYVIFGTPMVLLLTDFSGYTQWSVALDRIALTVIGGMLALVGSYLLWPSWHRDRLSTELSGMIDACRQYLAVTLAGYLGDYNASALRAGWWNAGAAITAAAAGLKQMASEPARRRLDASEANELVSICQQLRDQTLTLATARSSESQVFEIPGLAGYASALDSQLAAAVVGVSGRPAGEPLDLAGPTREVTEYLADVLDRRRGEVADGYEGTELHRRLVAVLPAALPLTQIPRLVAELDGLGTRLARAG